MKNDKIIYKLPEKHTVYKVNDKIVPSVTTVLGMIGSKNLIDWANNLGFKGINSNEITQRSAYIGTLTHLLCELYIKKLIDDFDIDKFMYINKEYDDNMVTESVNAYESFLQFCIDKKDDIHFEFSEKKLVSYEYQYGGTIDIIGTYKNKPAIYDIKTSNYMSRKMFFQLAAYRQLVKENLNLDVEYLIVIKLSKEYDKNYEYKAIQKKNINQYFNVFEKALELYKVYNNQNYNDGLLF